MLRSIGLDRPKLALEELDSLSYYANDWVFDASGRLIPWQAGRDRRAGS